MGPPRRSVDVLLQRHVRTAAGSDDTISGLQTVYCDDFQCDSSPQVERAVRAFAKDIERCKSWTITIFAENVKYSESGTVGVHGKDFYRELTWNQDNIEGYSTKILAMKMLDNERAVIRWSFAGSKGLFGNLSGEVNSTISLNVLTGRVEEHSDVVSLGGNPLAQLWYKVTKLAWGSKLKAKQVGGQVDKALDRLSMDDQQDPYYQDPTDPTRFSQSQDTGFADGVQWAIFLAIMWTMWQAYSYLGTMGF